MELKPCPFCGKPVNVYYSSATKGYYAVHLDEQNSDCIVLMPLLINGHRMLTSLSDAYAAWNRRAEDVVPMGFHERALAVEIKNRMELEKKIPKWISVKDALPGERRDGFSDDVLMLIEQPDGDVIWRDIFVGYYLYDSTSDETGWWVMMTCDCTKVGEHKHGNGKVFKRNEYVTHWMPLPEMPEEETNGQT